MSEYHSALLLDDCVKSEDYCRIISMDVPLVMINVMIKIAVKFY